jgi:hypothetical protein
MQNNAIFFFKGIAPEPYPLVNPPDRRAPPLPPRRNANTRSSCAKNITHAQHDLTQRHEHMVTT